MDRYIARVPGCAHRKLGHGVIVMLAADSHLFRLNEQAGAIWLAADGAATLEKIVRDAVCGAFDVDFDTAYADACALVDRLSACGLLIVSPEPVSARA